VARSQVPPGNAVLEALPLVGAGGDAVLGSACRRRRQSLQTCVTRREPGNEATRRVARSQVPPGNAVLEALPLVGAGGDAVLGAAASSRRRRQSLQICVTRREPGNEATRRVVRSQVPPGNAVLGAAASSRRRRRIPSPRLPN